jgi:glycosyltransferase involved in cell wall biosynthesis
MKMLASFERVWAVSRASGQELEAFWRWQGLSHTPQVAFLPLGADFDAAPRAALHSRPQGKPVLLCCGILEPRKNQTVLLDSCPDLWRSGLEFELHLVGRVNPNFGDAILKKLRSLSSEFPDLKFHEAASDAELSGLYARASATLFPTIAEGCGLPLLESLWRGLPCLCSDLPVLRENADAGGCLTVAATDPTAWAESIRRLLTEPRLWERLAQEAGSRPLPTWKESGQILRQGLTEVSESQ